MAKFVLITGANRGIGLEFARQYAADGWRVHACCRDPEGATGLGKALAGRDGEIHALDVASPQSIAALAAALDGAPIDVLINNAGAGGGDRQDFGAIDYDDWDRTLRVNTFGPYRVSEALADNVAASRHRTIVNISSRRGSIADNDDGGEHIYRTSKTALNMVSVNLAHDLGPRGVIVLAFHPGWVRTDMGGPDAPVTPQGSVREMRATIATATIADSGRFMDREGAPLPW